MADLMSHGHMRHFGWNVFAVVEYRHHATVEALHAAAILLQLMRYVIILIKLLCMYVCMYVPGGPKKTVPQF